MEPLLKQLLSGILLLTVIGPACVWAAGSDELWKMTTKTDMPGMPMPEVTQTVCLTKGEAYKPGKVPHQKNCKMTDIKVSGGRTTWKIHCAGMEKMDGNGEVIRTGNTMKGSMKLSSKDIQMTQVFSGKRIGTCKAK
jgi:hypothetical protein